MAILGPLKIPEIGFTENLRDMKSLKYPHCVSLPWKKVASLSVLKSFKFEENASENNLCFFFRCQLTHVFKRALSKSFPKLFCGKNIPEINQNRLKH